MISVAVGIIVNSKSPDHVLLCQRRRASRYPLKWEFPGGKVEPGEEAETCLRRELEEELGISGEIGTIYHRQQHAYADSGSFDVVYYRVSSFSGDIVNRVFETYRWVRIPELARYDILEGNQEVVRKLMSEHAAVVADTN